MRLLDHRADQGLRWPVVQIIRFGVSPLNEWRIFLITSPVNLRHASGMGFHFEEEHIANGSIDNRTQGRTVLKFNFTNHTSSLVTLQGNPCRDLAGSLWKFKNPHARMEEVPGEHCFFIPALCEGAVGHISYTRKCEVPVLPPDEHYDQLFDDDQEDPPTKVAPILELEWFSQKFKQVEIDCQQMLLELVEMSWSLSAEEAARGEALVEQTREELFISSDDGMESFYEEMDLIEEYLEEDVEPHEIEEICFLIVQDFIINSSDDTERNMNLHSDLLKLQEQVAGAFLHLDHDGEFEDVRATIALLTAVLPFIDRASASARDLVESTAGYLLQLREGVVTLRDELAGLGED